MGNGYFDGQKLHFVATASFSMPSGSPEETTWRVVLQNASAHLHAATFGQVQIGTVYLADNNIARVDSDVLIVGSGPPAESSASRGRFGLPGGTMSLLGDAIPRIHVAVHEFAHHLWGLGDEYSGRRTLTIDLAAAVPDLRTVVVTDNLVVNELVGAGFYLVYANNAIGRGTIISNDQHRIVLDRDLPLLPSAAVSAAGGVQSPASCAQPAVTGASV